MTHPTSLFAALTLSCSSFAVSPPVALGPADRPLPSSDEFALDLAASEQRLQERLARATRDDGNCELFSTDLRFFEDIVTLSSSPNYPVARVVYIDASAPLGGDGSSWNSAFQSIQDALGSESYDSDLVEFRLAGGTYRADTFNGFNTLDPELTAQDGQPKLFVYRTQAQALPLTLSMLECHQLGSQTFVPLADLSFVVVVACSASDTVAPQPDLSTLRAFWVDGHQGVTLAPGTWHHPLISLHDGELVVLERAAQKTDCLIQALSPAVTLKARPL